MTPHAITCDVASQPNSFGQGISSSISYVANPFLVVHNKGVRSFGIHSFEKSGISKIAADGQAFFALYEMKNAERSKGEIGAAFSSDQGTNWQILHP